MTGWAATATPTRGAQAVCVARIPSAPLVPPLSASVLVPDVASDRNVRERPGRVARRSPGTVACGDRS